MSFQMPSTIQANKYPASVGVSAVTPVADPPPPVSDVAAVPVVLTNGTWAGVTAPDIGTPTPFTSVTMQTYNASTPYFCANISSESGTAQFTGFQSSTPSAILQMGNHFQASLMESASAAGKYVVVGGGTYANGTFGMGPNAGSTVSGEFFLDSTLNFNPVSYTNPSPLTGLTSVANLGFIQSGTNAGALVNLSGSSKYIKDDIKTLVGSAAYEVVRTYPPTYTFSYIRGDRQRYIGNIAEEVFKKYGNDTDLQCLVVHRDEELIAIRYDLYSSILAEAMKYLYNKQEELFRLV